MSVSAARLTTVVVKVSSAASSAVARSWRGNLITNSATQAGGGSAPVENQAVARDYYQLEVIKTWEITQMEAWELCSNSTDINQIKYLSS